MYQTLTKLILDCINENLEEDFHREHHVHDHHVKIYSEEQIEEIKRSSYRLRSNSQFDLLTSFQRTYRVE